MSDKEYKEVDTDSFLAQSEVRPETVKALLNIERNLIKEYSLLMTEKHELMQRVYKLEEEMADRQRRIEAYQRIRLEAANAEAKPQPKLIKDLQNETGLSVKEINHALNLLKDLQKTELNTRILRMNS